MTVTWATVIGGHAENALLCLGTIVIRPAPSADPVTSGSGIGTGLKDVP